MSEPHPVLGLFEAYGDAVYRTAYGMTGDAATAQDVTQDVFLYVLRNPEAPSQVGSINAWLHRAAVNGARKARRGHTRRVVREQEVGRRRGESMAETDQERGQLLTRLREAVAELPEKLRAAVVLHYFQQLSYEEAGKVLECAPGTVGSRLTAAREKLRERMSPAMASVAPLPLADLDGLFGSLCEEAVLDASARGAIQGALQSAAPVAATGLASSGLIAATAGALVVLVGLLVGFVLLLPPANTGPAVARGPAPGAPLGGAAPVATTTVQAPAAQPVADEQDPQPNPPVAAPADTEASEPKAAVTKQRAALEVVVRDHRGQLVPGAQVQLIDAKESERADEAPDVRSWYRSARTDAEGRVRIEGEEVSDTRVTKENHVVLGSKFVPLAIGRTLYVFARRGFEEGYVGPIELRGPETIDVELQLRDVAVPRPRRGTLLITVLCDGRPLANTRLDGNWLAKGGNGSSRFPAGPIRGTTDALGQLAVSDLRPAERYQITLQHEGYAPATFELAIPADATTRHTAAFEKGVTLVGKLTLAPGLSVQDVNSVNGYLEGRGDVTPSAKVLPEGRYRFENLQPGRYRIDVLLNRHANRRGEVEVPASATPVQGPEFRLGFGARVIGKVVDTNGKPFSDFESVWISGDGLNTSPKLSPDGSFTVNGVAPGDYDLELNLSSGPFAKEHVFIDAHAHLSVAEGATEVDLGEVRFPVSAQPWTLRGRVLDADGNPVSSADVELVRPGGWPLTEVQTDAEGRFEIAEPKPGTVLVAAKAFEQQSSAHSFEVRGGETEEVTLRLTQRSGAIRGRLLPPPGLHPKHLPKLEVLCKRQAAGALRVPFASKAVHLQPDGSFELTGLSPGRYALNLISITQTQIVEVVAGQATEAVIDLAHATEGVRVVLEGGERFRPQVNLSWDAANGAAGGSIWHGLREKPETSFGFVPAGPFTVEVRGAHSSNTRPFMRLHGVAQPGEVPEIRFSWPSPDQDGGARGRVANAPPRALVWAFGETVSCFRLIDDDGTYRLQGLPAGDYRVFVSRGEPSDTTGGTPLTIRAGEVVELDLEAK